MTPVSHKNLRVARPERIVRSIRCPQPVFRLQHSGQALSLLRATTNITYVIRPTPELKRRCTGQTASLNAQFTEAHFVLLQFIFSTWNSWQSCICVSFNPQCLTTGPYRTRSSTSSFQYPSSRFVKVSQQQLTSSSSSSRHFYPYIFPPITCYRAQLLRKMWPIQLAYALLNTADSYDCAVMDVRSVFTPTELKQW